MHVKVTMVDGAEGEIELGPYTQGVALESAGQAGQAKLIDVATRNVIVRQLGPYWTLTDISARSADRMDARSKLFERVFIQTTPEETR